MRTLKTLLTTSLVVAVAAMSLMAGPSALAQDKMDKKPAAGKMAGDKKPGKAKGKASKGKKAGAKKAGAKKSGAKKSGDKMPAGGDKMKK